MAERKQRGFKDGKPTVQVTDDHTDATPEPLPPAKPAVVKETMVTVADGRGQRRQMPMSEYRELQKERLKGAEAVVDKATTEAKPPAKKAPAKKKAAAKKKAPKKAKAKAKPEGGSNE